jgi:hypothetical protein
VKPTTSSKVYSTRALLYALIATETHYWDGMAKNALGQSIKWMKLTR